MCGLIFRILVLHLAFLFAGGVAAQELSTQTSNEFAVTVKVTPRSLQGATWDFEVVFDTHSRELKDDLLKDATLVAPDGRQTPPLAWQGDAPGGHHRKGMLRFNALQPAPASVELRIARAGEPKPRTFRWKLK
ncbi:hypothetical protein [Herbaspirillum sp. ST 5-3]|uniref:hypothetical protein n=1 Tax=Oxalobacteraceae TaxID=75682 RepID=UPI0010A36B06|nr:hypothetical protein [Herbaspirillum sp. ST 5-3]